MTRRGTTRRGTTRSGWIAWASTPVAAALAALAIADAGAATIEGSVALPATAAPVVKPRDATSATYTITAPDPPAAIVYLEGDFRGAGGASPGAEVAQREYQFRPGILAVRTGSVVRFPNFDDEYHSVFSYSKSKSFDLGRYRKDETPAELTFDRPGAVKLFCEIHDHMRGTILVLDTPYFQRTDAAGAYRLTDLPAGRYVLKAWVDENDVRERPVELKEGATVRVDFPPG